MLFTTKEDLMNTNSNVCVLIGFGHGKDTAGKRSPMFVNYQGEDVQLREYLWVRDVGKRFIHLLQQEGMSYHILNTEINDVSPQDKCIRENVAKKRINKEGYRTYAMDLHANAAGVESANGYEVFTSIGETKADQIAEIYYNNAKASGMWRMRSGHSKENSGNDKEARFWFLRHTHSPAILPEMGFYTNRAECLRMLSEEYKDAVAQHLLESHKEVLSQIIL